MIEDFIKDLFDDEDSIEIQRNDLAEKFNCVPGDADKISFFCIFQPASVPE